MKKLKKIMMILLAVTLIFTGTGFFSGTVEAKAASTSSYMYWDTDGHGGGSKIKNGCIVVGLTKMLINTGAKSSTKYKPKNMYSDLKKYGVTFGKNNWMNGNWPAAAAKASGKKLYHYKKLNLSGLSNTQKKTILMNYAKAGYQMIVQVKEYHWVYMYNQKSIKANTPWIMDSIRSSNANYRKNNNVARLDKNYSYKNVAVVQVFGVKNKSKKQTFTVKYNANGGKGEMANTTVTYKKATATRKNTFTRAGYTFAGWNIQRASDGKCPYRNKKGVEHWYKKGKQPKGYSLKVYGNGSKVSQSTSYLGDIVTFYAVWKKKPTTNSGTTNTSGNTGSNSTSTSTSTKKPTTPANNTQPAQPASTLALKNKYYPSTTYAQGSAFTITGTVSSNYKISNVTVKVATTSGTQKFAASVNPNAKSYSLYNLDSKMAFSKLPAGNYVYTVTAKDAKVTKTLLTSKFSVKKANITGSGLNYPTTLKKGSYFTIKGTVKSSDKLKLVHASVHTTAGVLKFQNQASTSATSYDVYKLDSKMAFKSLPAGSYIYRVNAIDSKGVEKFLITKKFTVK